MATIRVMPEALANKIAAGEVVERPASVVKELVENAIDAGATQISVEVGSPAYRSIRVVDNGSGMSEDDALLCLERHATSKIFAEGDLGAIRTLGFRGEALPSIAAVSRLELRTRTREATAGTRVVVGGGVVREVCECGCSPGTQVWVRDLFFNQPARRKFLKGERTELGHLGDTLLRYALARPEIHFSLRLGSHQVQEWPAASSLGDRLGQCLKTHRFHALVPVASEDGDLRVDGFLSPPELHRGTSQTLFLFVNGRPVRDRLLNLAVMEAYRTLLPRGRFPLGALFVELPAERVDVNVHPSKAEVRFQDGRQLVEAVTRAAHDALTTGERRRWERPVAAGQEQGARIEAIQEGLAISWGEGRRGEPDPVASALLSVPAAATAQKPATPASDGWKDRLTPAERRFGDLIIIGQLVGTYLLCEAPDGLIIIDQHAAHERVLFESLRVKLTAASLPRQELLLPETLELNGAESAWLEETLPVFTQLGFAIEPFGPTTFVVRAIPASALREEPLALLRDLVAEGCAGVAEPGTHAVMEGLLQLLACRLAIKAGQRLEVEEMRSLLQQLDGLDRSSTCPHGRPLWWKLTIREVERFFGRA
ncbi:MAG TPA: DNA mismatch repair endonuclease MutL [Syntrophobacteria bacterium]|nr:DNA mismatch repair endonuclease MutL [Syntrophobacteria bacterium]